SPGDRKILYALTVAKYHRMLEQGILPEGKPFELIAGQVVRKERHARGDDPMTVGYAHAVAVTKLGKLNAKLERIGCHMRIQQPVTLPPFSEPEPDGAIVFGTEERYGDHHPGSGEV